MPKKPERPWDGKSLIHLELHPIRQHADAFSAWMNCLPKDERELNAVLWIFGEQLCGDMEKRMNHSMKIAQDAINCQPMTPFTACKDVSQNEK